MRTTGKPETPPVTAAAMLLLAAAARADDGKTPYAVARRSRWGADPSRKARTVEILLKHGAVE